MNYSNRSNIARAISVALMCSTSTVSHAIAAPPLWAMSGEYLTVDDEYFEATSDKPFAVASLLGSHVVATNVHAVSSEIGAAGLLAAYKGATLDFNGGSVTGAADGVRSESGGKVNLRDVSIDVTGSGVWVWSDVDHYGVAQADISGGSIVTAGAPGVFVTLGGEARIDGTRITNVSVGPRGPTLYATSGGHIFANDVVVSASGDGVRGVYAETTIVGAGTIEISNATVSTSGAGASAMSAVSSSGIWGEWPSNETSILASNVSLHTAGEGSHALLVSTARQVQVGGASSLRTEGAYSSGVEVTTGAVAALYSSHVETLGEAAFGVSAQERGQVSMQGGSITTSGRSASALFANGAGTAINLRDVQVHAAGELAYAAEVASGSSASISGGQLFAQNAAALYLDGGALVAADGAVLSSATGVLAKLGAGLSSQVTFDTGTQAHGDIVFGSSEPQARSTQLRATGGSQWHGMTNALESLDIEGGSLWNVTGDSSIGSLSVSASRVAFDHSDGLIKTLQVDGNLQLDNALLAMNTQLDGDASLSDRLHVKGSASGNAAIVVNNIGGRGAQTDAGIQLVQVDGASDAKFSLAGRAVAGAYEYSLHQGRRSGVNDGGWYLRSELVPVIDPCVQNPQAPECAAPTPEDRVDPAPAPVAPPSPLPPAIAVLRPEAGAYALNQEAAASMFNVSMHDRVGGPNLAPQPQADRIQAAGWARVTSSQARMDVNDQLNARDRQHVLQVGTDVGQWGRAGRGLAGVMLGSGESTQRVVSGVSGYSAEGKVKGTAVGLYGSWLQDAAGDSGLYVDGWAQLGRFRNQVQGQQLDKEHYRSRSTTASLEAGYAFAVSRGEGRALYVQPQVQLTWGDVRMRGGQHVEANGTHVSVAEGQGMRSRVGVRLFGHDMKPGINIVQPYLTANWLRAHGAANAVRLDESLLTAGEPRDVYEAKAGVQLQLRRGLTAWGEVSGSRGSDSYRQVGGMLGVRYSW